MAGVFTLATLMDSPSANVTPELLRAVRRGDQKAARQLVDMLYPLVITIVRRHLPREKAEEDLCQEVFLKMFTRLKQYSGDKTFDHWVSKIALHTCYDKLRKLSRRKVMSYAELDADEATFLFPTESFTSPQPLEGSPGLARDLLERLLAHLNPRETMIIRLLDLEEKSVNEVCNLID
ncbi:sigma-70 family RNA polymerase sigma factor [Akkermansiaceae bacterium]|nr:sigma-70 family RNA polymerase sigma factor [Akkermansiaceae bacterium]